MFLHRIFVETSRSRVTFEECSKSELMLHANPHQNGSGYFRDDEGFSLYNKLYTRPALRSDTVSERNINQREGKAAALASSLFNRSGNYAADFPLVSPLATTIKIQPERSRTSKELRV